MLLSDHMSGEKERHKRKPGVNPPWVTLCGKETETETSTPMKLGWPVELHQSLTDRRPEEVGEGWRHLEEGGSPPPVWEAIRPPKELRCRVIWHLHMALSKEQTCARNEREDEWVESMKGSREPAGPRGERKEKTKSPSLLRPRCASSSPLPPIILLPCYF